MNPVRKPKFLFFDRHGSLDDFIFDLTKLDGVEVVKNFFQDIGSFIDTQNEGLVFDHLVLDCRVTVHELVRVVVVELDVFVEFCCKKATGTEDVFFEFFRGLEGHLEGFEFHINQQKVSLSARNEITYATYYKLELRLATLILKIKMYNWRYAEVIL